MNNTLIVVSSRFCAPHELQLRLREQISWSGDDFNICQMPSRQPWFVIKGSAFSLRDQKVLRDVHGRIVATMRHPIFHGFHPRMQVDGPGYSFEVRSRGNALLFV